MANYIAPATFPAGVKLGAVAAASVTAPASGELLLVANSSDSNKLYVKNASGEVTAGGLWEVVNGKLQPIASLTTYPARIGGSQETFNVSDTGFTNAGASITHRTGYWENGYSVNANAINAGTPNTDANTPYVITRSGETAPHAGWHVFDGVTANDNNGMWFVQGTTVPRWVGIDLGTAMPITAYKFMSHVNPQVPTAWTLKGSNNEIDWDTLDQKTGQNPTEDSLTPTYTPTLISNYRYIRFYVDACKAGYSWVGIRELFLYTGSLATTGNTIDTADLATGQSFAPATLKVFDETYNGDGVTGEILDATYLITYRKINGAGTTDFSASLLTSAQFKALPSSTFTQCSELKLRIQPIGTQKIGGLQILSTSAAVEIDPGGSITGNINGLEVWKTTVEGDVTAVDMVVNSIKANGLTLSQVSGETVTAPASGELTLLSNRSDSARLYAKNASGETSAVSPWEVLDNRIQPIPALSTYPQRLGSTETTYTIIGSGGSNGFTNAGANITFSSGKWSITGLSNEAFNASTPQTSAVSPYTISEDPAQIQTNYEAWHAFNGSLSQNIWTSTVVAPPHYLVLDLGSGVTKTFKQVRFYGVGNNPALPRDFTIRGSNDNFSTSDLLLDYTGLNAWDGWSSLLDFTAFGAYRYYKFTFTLNNGDQNTAIWEIDLRGLATSGNTIETPNLVPTGFVSFSPSTLVVLDGTGSTTPVPSTLYNVAYDATGGGFGNLMTGAAFQALSATQFLNLSVLKLRLQPTETQTIGAVSIRSTSASVIVDPSGSITGNINGSDVWKTTTEGDVTAVDMVVASVTASGEISAGDTDLNEQTKIDDYTLAVTDAGIVTKVSIDGKIMTLPATVAYLPLTVMNAGADGAVAVSISPNANDKIIGMGSTAYDNKDIINTKATAKRGDYVRLIGDGVDGWYIQEMKGIWAREA